MIYKIDLHTHSIISHDGGISAQQYQKILDRKILDYIAITDHNETKFAGMMHQKIGEKIIIGEEIMTTEGEMIGLFLNKTIPAGLPAKETAEAIHHQGGLVYIPHPFETLRKGMQSEVLPEIADMIDIVEVFNGRARWRGKPAEAENFVNEHHLAGAASSDAHCKSGIGYAYSSIKNTPAKNTLVKLLKEALLQKNNAPWYTLLCPQINRMKHKIGANKYE